MYSSNQITLPVGVFEFEITAAHFGTGLTGLAIARPDNTLVAAGMCINIGSSGGNVYLKQRIQSTSTFHTFKIRSYTQTAVTNFGLGQSLPTGAAVSNIYTIVSIMQVS